MSKILIFILNTLACIGIAGAAVRDGTSVSRTKSDTTTQSQHRKSTVINRGVASRTALIPRSVDKKSTRENSDSTAASDAVAKSRIANNAGPTPTAARTSSPRRANTNARNMSPIISRASTTTMSNTRTGAEYEQCKNTFFSCMDQFCTLKNDDYRRCSCSDRVFELDAVRDVLLDAGEQLTVFTENLDVVGMTAAQAASMRSETEGESALHDDKSASKALLQAIMNSIRGEDSTVGGKYSDLNSINIAFDTVNAFGMTDVGQAIAAYNGVALYNAVYPQCRNAVRADCNDASLQRAINAYLMAIEQDCNTVQTAIEQTQAEMKSAVREGSAMLDLARIENRQKHNSSDITTCINMVEDAILSEQVCGANYHKCLDNGKYIDISTGKPITGVSDFYKLEKLLVFSDGIDAADQELSKNSSNRTFVQNFEKRVKKFAEPALDTCVENADFVWSQYLDRAMLAIYYAQRAKVAEIKQGCFDYVSACYMNGDQAITTAMSELMGEPGVVIQPSKVALNSQMCSDYIASCNNMFDNNIIADYIENIKSEDTLTACRAVVKQCFDKYGGTNYENFYYPYSGLFQANSEFAPDWFSLYEITGTGDNISYATYEELHPKKGKIKYKSECATQLQDIPACSDPQMIEDAFGGFDVMTATKSATSDDTGLTTYEFASADTAEYTVYGLLDGDDFKHRYTRPSGVATEVYNQIISILSTQCMNLQGRFVEVQFIRNDLYSEENPCLATFSKDGAYNNSVSNFVELYAIGENEDMCPRDYGLGVATKSWGACLCWENGARRSKWGKSAKCVAAFPVNPIDDKGTLANDISCKSAGITLVNASSTSEDSEEQTVFDKTFSEDSWCTQPTISSLNQVCPKDGYTSADSNHCKLGDTNLTTLPEGIQ